MYFDEDAQINYDEGPLDHEVEPERRHSVELETVGGATARYTMTERTKRSVVRHIVLCVTWRFTVGLSALCVVVVL